MTEFFKKAAFPPDFTRYSISNILENLSQFDEDHALELFGMDIRRLLVPCPYCPETPIASMIQETITDVQNGIYGICLECIKKVRYMGTRRACCPGMERLI